METRRILVVEDEAIVALDICNRLKHMGYEVAGRCASGEQALQLAETLRPDMILMDIMLEGAMDGVEAAAHIRERLGIPVVFLTAYADSQTLARAKVTGPFGYIIKPFEDRELQTTIEMAAYKFDTDAKLVRSERLLATTLHHLGEAVVTTGADGLVRFLNPEAQRMLGSTPEQARDKLVDEVLKFEDMHPGQPLRQPTGGKSTAMLHALDGRVLPVEIINSPLVDDRGLNMGSVLVIRDISESVQAEAAMRQYVASLRSTLEATVEALGVTAEKRDPYTAGHQRRVSDLAVAIGRRMGLEQNTLEGLRAAGLLHDIGKIYIPAEILAKPAVLTPIEMGLMKTHPEVGYEILRNIPFPWPVAQVVLEHHERQNGSGYPSGLRAPDILLESRILCVADVVEAMSSHRPYRAALGLPKALEEIAKNRGTFYDPDVVDACLEMFASNAFSFDADGR